MSKQDIKQYVANKLQSNPQLYGSDNGNTHLVYDYFKKEKGIIIPKYMDSISSTLIRAKNLLLEKEPSLDYRTKHKGIFTGCKFNPLEKLKGDN